MLSPFRILAAVAGLICALFVGGMGGAVVGFATGLLTVSIWAVPMGIKFYRNRRVYHYEAEGHMRVGNWSEAERWYGIVAKSEKLAESRAEMLSNVAIAQIKQKKYSEAEETVKAALGQTGNPAMKAKLIGLRGEAEFGRGDVEAAIRSQREALQFAESKKGNDIAVADRRLQLGRTLMHVNLGEAIQVLETAVALARNAHGEGSIEAGKALQTLGEAHMAAHAYPAAIETFRAASDLIAKTLTQDAPEFMVTLEWLGKAHAGAGDLETAVECFERAVKLHEQHVGKSTPEFISALLFLARIYLARGLYAKAIEVGRFAHAQINITKDPRGDEGLELLATIYEMSGRSDEAASFRKKLSTAPKESAARY
ncbi:MAG TPA: tetratricopeptide repeat protein [Bryobacteraceae bacterium]|nr:tetratricopeptide repeat protein [Bryobacteraceae bacterium]